MSDCIVVDSVLGLAAVASFTVTQRLILALETPKRYPSDRRRGRRIAEPITKMNSVFNLRLHAASRD